MSDPAKDAPLAVDPGTLAAIRAWAAQVSLPHLEDPRPDIEPGETTADALHGETPALQRSSRMPDTLSPERTAQVAHRVNQEICRAVGDPVKPDWHALPPEEQDGVIGGVRYILEDPDISPADHHEAWRAAKVREGYTFGLEIDHDKKRHPDLVPYDHLPVAARCKGAAFRGVVLALKDALVDG